MRFRRFTAHENMTSRKTALTQEVMHIIEENPFEKGLFLKLLS